MKKIIKTLGLILIGLTFVACPRTTDDETLKEIDDETSKEIKVDGLKVNGKGLGSETWQAEVSDNTIIWPQDKEDGNCGWDLSGINLSSYDRVRIEIESTDVPLQLILNNKDYNSAHCYMYPVESNTYEAILTGEGSNVSDKLDKSKGLRIYFNTLDKKLPREKELKTIVKSIQFLTGWRNEELKVLDVPFQNFWFSYVYDGGVIEWLEPEGASGWELTDHDLSAYKKIRIETEGDAPIRIRLMMSDDTHAFYWSKKDAPGVFEANLDGSEAEYYTQNLTAGSVVEKIQLVCEGQTKAGSKTTVKSVSLLTE